MPSFSKGEQIIPPSQFNFDTFKDSVLDEIIEQSISHHIGEHETLSSHYLGFAKSKLYQIDLISFFKRLTVYTDS